MNAGYKKATSKILAAVLSLLMVFGNVASPLAGAFYAYALDGDETVAEATTDAGETADDASVESTEDQSTQEETATEEDSEDSTDADAQDNSSDDADATVDEGAEAKTMLKAAPAEPADAVYVDGQKGDDENDGTEGDPFKTLEKAIESSNDGATINVLDTVDYVGVNQNISLGSRKIVRANESGNYALINIENSTITIEGKGAEIYDKGVAQDYPMLAVDGSVVKISGVDFKGGHNSNERIEKIPSEDNWAGQGGAIGIRKSSSVSISNSEFSGNRATLGGAIFVDSSTLNVNKGTSFNGNEAVYDCGTDHYSKAFAAGGAIFVTSCHGESYGAATVNTDASYKGNIAPCGGAIATGRGHSGNDPACEYSMNGRGNGSIPKSVVNVTGGVFNGNQSNVAGGAIYVQANSIGNITAGSFVNNYSKGEYTPYSGGAIYVQGKYGRTPAPATLNLSNALITENHAGSIGGGIFLCPDGEGHISGDQGAAIYDNISGRTQYADVYITSPVYNQVVSLSDYALNSVENNWKTDGNQDYNAIVQGKGDAAFINDLDDSAKADASKNALVIFKYNKTDAAGGAISNNGILNVGQETATFFIKKVDSETKEGLSGAEFTLAKEDFSLTQVTETINETAGIGAFRDLSEGTYTLTEVKAPKGYENRGLTWTVVVAATSNGFTITVTDSDGKEVAASDRWKEASALNPNPNYYSLYALENEKSRITISKVDMGSGKELAGADMVVKKAGGTVVDSWTSTTEAHKISNIEAGDYTLKETVAPEGYECVETEISFHVELDEDGKATVTTKEVKENGNVVNEIDEETGALILKNDTYKGPEVEKYVNKDVTYDFDNFDQVFEYEVMAYVPYDATKATITDDLVDSLEFVNGGNVKVYDMGIENNHKVDGTVATNGTLIEGVNPSVEGKHLEVVMNEEQVSPYRKHWIKVTFDARITEDAREAVMAKLAEKAENGTAATAANQWENIDDNLRVLTDTEHDGVPNKANYAWETSQNGNSKMETNTVTVEPKTVNLKVKKSWKNVIWNSDTSVTFAVYKYVNGQKAEKVDEVTLDSNKTETTVTLPRLENVKYQAEEVKVTKNGVESTVDTATGNLVIGAINYIKDIITNLFAGEEDGEHETSNELKVEVKINKTDLGGEEIEGATIVVYDSEGNEVKSWESKKDETFDLMLEPGSYTFKETVAPEGYECVETKIEFKVDEDGKVTVKQIDGVLEQLKDGTMVLKDTPIRKISKNELGGSEIDGAKMTLTMPDGTVKEWTSSAEEAYEFAAVPGTYKLKEVTPPSDYTQVTTEIEFTVDDHGNITIVTTEVDGGGKISVNEDGDTVVLEDAPKKEVNIAKTDFGGEELKGATITVTGKDNAGNEVNETWKSETTAHTLKLDPGTYTMEEKVAPAGYQCVETKIQFSVDADGNVTVEKIDGVLEQLEDGTIILKDAPEKPAIEKYVNKKYENLGEKDRDGTVHYDLSAFNEVYTYDIQAYITADATIVEVNDELKEVLEFVGDAPTAVVVKDGEGDSGAVAPKLTKAGEAVTDYSIDAAAWANGKLVLTMGSDAEDAPKLYPNGKWLQITFDAKIKDKYKSLEAIKAADGVFTEITVNEEIDDADVNATFSGAEADAHEGIVNDSSYRIKSKVAALNVNVDNEWAYGVKSNTVTVVPPTTEISFSKTDLDGKELPGAEMVLTDAEGNVIDKWTSTTEDHILNLADGEYIMTEKVAPEGYYCVTTEMHFEVKDGEVTLKTAVVDNDGEIEVLAGTHIILKDAPKVQSEEEKKDDGDEGEEEVVEKRVPEKSQVKEAYSARVNTGDDSMLYIWAAMLMISLAAIAVTIIRRRRTN